MISGSLLTAAPGNAPAAGGSRPQIRPLWIAEFSWTPYLSGAVRVSRGSACSRLFGPFLSSRFLSLNLYFVYTKYLALRNFHCEKQKVPCQQCLPGTAGHEKKSRNLSHFCGFILCVKSGIGLVFQNVRWYNFIICTVSKDICSRFYYDKI